MYNIENMYVYVRLLDLLVKYGLKPDIVLTVVHKCHIFNI